MGRSNLKDRLFKERFIQIKVIILLAIVIALSSGDASNHSENDTGAASAASVSDLSSNSDINLSTLGEIDGPLPIFPDTHLLVEDLISDTPIEININGLTSEISFMLEGKDSSGKTIWGAWISTYIDGQVYIDIILNGMITYARRTDQLPTAIIIETILDEKGEHQLIITFRFADGSVFTDTPRLSREELDHIKSFTASTSEPKATEVSVRWKFRNSNSHPQNRSRGLAFLAHCAFAQSF